MSWVVMGQTRGRRPVVISMMVSRSSLTLRIHPSFTVGVIAKPRHFAMRFPFVVSMETTASMESSISSLFITAMSTGEPMNGTGWWGVMGELGQMWVATTTSPLSSSPFTFMSASFRATERAVMAPSASETIPVISGRAPTPPSLPMTPRVGAEPSLCFPSVPGIRILIKSVWPFSPLIVLTDISVSPRDLSRLATSSPVTVGLSRSS